MDCDKTIDELQNLEAIAFGYSENGEVFGMDCSDFEQIMTDTADLIRELLERAEKAERERDAAVREIPKICYYCKHRKGWKVCSDYSGNENAETCEKWEWRGMQEE